PTETVWQLTTEGKGLPDTALKSAPKQATLLRHLQLHHTASREDIATLDVAISTVRQLEKKGLVESVERTINPAEIAGELLLGETPLTLNDEQQGALTQLRYGEFSSYLLEGATGSGKTEVYLQAIANVLEAGRSAL